METLPIYQISESDKNEIKKLIKAGDWEYFDCDEWAGSLRKSPYTLRIFFNGRNLAQVMQKVQTVVALLNDIENGYYLDYNVITEKDQGLWLITVDFPKEKKNV